MYEARNSRIVYVHNTRWKEYTLSNVEFTRVFLGNQADEATAYHSSILQQFDGSRGLQSAPFSGRLLRSPRAVLSFFCLQSQSPFRDMGFSQSRLAGSGNTCQHPRVLLIVRCRCSSLLCAILGCTPASDWERTRQSSSTRQSVVITLVAAEVPGQKLGWRLLARVSSHRCGLRLISFQCTPSSTPSSKQ